MKGIFYTVEGEIAELENLMSDIRAKITDYDILEKEEIRKLEEKDTNGAGIQSQTDPASFLEDSPIIENLPLMMCQILSARRGRQMTGTEASAVKKICPDDSVVKSKQGQLLTFIPLLESQLRFYNFFEYASSFSTWSNFGLLVRFTIGIRNSIGIGIFPEKVFFILITPNYYQDFITDLWRHNDGYLRR
jgi:hypothetical protein